MKLTEAPGARLTAVKTAVPGVGRSLVTTMFVIGMLPVLLTVPPKVAVAPGAPAIAGQVAVTAMRGEATSGQVTLAKSETGAPQRLVAVAVKVSDTEQFVGAR